MKTKKNIFLFTLIGLLFFEYLSFAQNDIIIEDLSVTTELPEGAITKMVQDEQGFIWLATWKGLYRYDGYKVTNFSKINSKFEALKIKELLIEENNLWVGTFVTGLYRIDLRSYDFSQYTTNSDDPYKIGENNVISLMNTDSRKILAGTERAGLYIIDSNYKVVKAITHDNSPNILIDEQVSSIKSKNENKVYLGNSSLVEFNYETYESKLYDFPELRKHINDIYVISDNKILVSTPYELYSIDFIENEKKITKVLDTQSRSIIKNIFNDKETYLLGTFKGLYEYDPLTNACKKYQPKYENQKELDINKLITTKDNTVLIASETGLHAMYPRKIHFESIRSDNDDNSPEIISKIEKFKDQIYVGGWGKGLMKYSAKSKKLEDVQFKFDDGPNPQFIYTIKSIDDKLWFSTKNQMGIFCFDTNKEPIPLTYYSSFEGINKRAPYTVTSIAVTNKKDILLGTWDGLLYYYHKELDDFRLIKDTAGNLPETNNISMNSIMEDNLGNIWIALGGGGILKLKIENYIITSQERFTTQDGLSSNFATFLFQSRNNKIWIGTEAGLTVFENDKFIPAFNNDIIFDFQSITEDPIGFLWLGTQKGILRINSNHLNEPYKLFDESDGLSNNSFYLNSIFAADDYKLYFGGIDGLDFFTPYKIEYNFTKPEPKITDFSLFNNYVFPSDAANNNILSTNITATDKIKLKYDQNTFSFEFSNLEYQIQEKCQFAYKMDGVDKDWNYKDSDNRYALYTKLAPGNYTFHLKSTNNDGVWCDNPIQLELTITPPLWASTWAYIVYFVLAMFAISTTVYIQVLKFQTKHKQQLKEVEYTKQKELDEMKLKFFTNISHEFRTPLTLILGPLARILENDTSNPYKEKHLMIFRNASRLLQLTNRIMDFRKSEKDKLRLKVEKTNFSEFIYNIFLFFNYEAQKRNIDYRFKTNIEGEIYIDQEFVESITFNLLSNAFKYTADNKSILVSIDQNGDSILLTFTDTGRGIKTEELEHIFDRFYSYSKRNSAGIGLSFTKRLIEMHKGKIEVTSTFGEGSKFEITLPLKDIYTDEEKSVVQNKETIVDWRKIDQSIQEKVGTGLSTLKNSYQKEELIALVADDNFEVRQFIISLLENDFKIIEADNGVDALAKATENLPDIIISDIMMPEMDGLELCETLKNDSKTDHIPVILTTVLSSQDDRITGLSKGADSYIPKPIDPNHLLIRINKLIEKQLKLKEKFNLADYNTEHKEQEEPAEEVHPLVEKARKIVLENLDNSDYNIDDFCNDLGLSRMQLYRKFKAITGLSANSFIRKVRLHKAAELLLTGNYTVKEVTYDVGFIDLKYFRKCFNDEFGINPSEYAKKQNPN